jgi:nucleoside-diphosphate-sugar epimerase
VVYGPRDEAWTLSPLKLMRAGSMILPDNGRGLVTPIYIDDLVQGMLAVAEHGRIGESYILAGEETVTFREFFGYLGRMVGRDRFPSVPGRLAVAVAAGSELLGRLFGARPRFTKEAVRGTMMQVRYCGAKARTLGFTPRIGLEEGMRRVEEWLASEGQACLRG